MPLAVGPATISTRSSPWSRKRAPEAGFNEYGRLKAALLDRFGPRPRAKRRHFDMAKLGFGDNDLWIAATVLDRGAVLVSADPDFTRMADVVDLKIDDWTRS